jgi:hypothetical protein
MKTAKTETGNAEMQRAGKYGIISQMKHLLTILRARVEMKRNPGICFAQPRRNFMLARRARARGWD